MSDVSRRQDDVHSIKVYGYLPRSPNARVRQHFGRKLDERNFWEAVIGSAAYRQEIPKATQKMWCSVDLYKPGLVKLRDKDNLYASVKHLLDAMTLLKLIVDDAPEWLDLRYVKDHNGNKGYATEISLGVCDE
jgi:hypothetical protein